VRDFTRDDVDKRLKWQKDTGPFVANLNLQLGMPKERDRWFEQRLNRRNVLWFALDNEKRQMIGDLSLRNISWIEKSAALGIVIGRQYRSRGYGTESIKILLNHVFDILGFNVLTLDAAAHNRAAVKCYKKSGFVQCGTFWGRPVPRVDPGFLKDDDYREYWRHFRWNKRNVLEVYYYKMQAESRKKSQLKGKSIGS
jgi:diamine N-acetyltransferase